MSDPVLAKIDAAARFLANARTLQEVNSVIGLADAVAVFAKRIGASRQTVNRANEIRLRAERKLGEILRVTPKNVGAKGSVSGSKREPVKDTTKSLADLGIGKKISSRAQILADTPKEQFESLLVVGPDQDLNHNRIVKQLNDARQREARRQKRIESLKDAPPLDNRTIVGDFRQNADRVPDGSLCLVYTDPPYDRESSRMLPDLAKFAAAKLADGDVLLI
jgi:hypothetical protein